MQPNPPIPSLPGPPLLPTGAFTFRSQNAIQLPPAFVSLPGPPLLPKKRRRRNKSARVRMERQAYRITTTEVRREEWPGQAEFYHLTGQGGTCNELDDDVDFDRFNGLARDEYMVQWEVDMVDVHEHGKRVRRYDAEYYYRHCEREDLPKCGLGGYGGDDDDDEYQNQHEEDDEDEEMSI